MLITNVFCHALGGSFVGSESLTVISPIAICVLVSPTQAVVIVGVLVTAGVLWGLGGGHRWRAAAADRLLYGLPIGSILTVGIVVSTYLFVQGGLWFWNDPLVLPFVSWSWLYPLGLLTAGITHGSPSHLLSNMTATLAIAPIAEYAWGHYTEDRHGPSTLTSSPWVRAVLLFPLVLLFAAVLTSVFALGPGIGFSGAVFAIIGFALVMRPVWTLVGVITSSAFATLYQAIQQPVLRETIAAGPPTPPAWAGIGFHAHAIGFLGGVLIAIWLQYRRDHSPSFGRIALATLGLGLIQGLWLIVWPEGTETYVLYRGVGVLVLAGTALLIAEAAGGSERSLPWPTGRLVPSARQLAIVWLVLVWLGALGAIVGSVFAPVPTVTIGVLTVLTGGLVSVPTVPAIRSSPWLHRPLSRRQTATAVLAGGTIVLLAPGILFGLTVIDPSPDHSPSGDTVTINDYELTYAANATNPRQFAVGPPANGTETASYTGLIVTSEQRELWTMAIREDRLAYESTTTVVVGGVGWRQSIDVERTGWAVSGADTAYTVDLTINDTRTRSFTSAPVSVPGSLANTTVELVPADPRTQLRVTHRNGTTLDTVPVPRSGDQVAVGPIDVSTRMVDETPHVYGTVDGTTVLLAERSPHNASTAQG